MKTAVTDYLDALRIPYRLKPHAREVFTSKDAAIERGVRLSQIVKTMLLGNDVGEIVVAVLPGHRKLDVRKVQRLAGRKNLRFLGKEFVERKMGLVPGAIAPVCGPVRSLPMFVDPEVFVEDVIDISSGHPDAGVELTSRNLRALLEGATIVDLVKKE